MEPELTKEESLINEIEGVKVSTVLNNNHKEFGKKHLFDGSEETCWNSKQGSPQYILIKFKRNLNVSTITFTPQGGFAPKNVECLVSNSEDLDSLEKAQSYEFEDGNDQQIVKLEAKDVKILKFVVLSSYDFFGRVTLYELNLNGTV